MDCTPKSEGKVVNTSLARHALPSHEDVLVIKRKKTYNNYAHAYLFAVDILMAMAINTELMINDDPP